MSELILVRHGETSMAGTFCGHSDPELNERGRAQAAEVAAVLAKLPMSSIYTSDLRRARQTAENIYAAAAVEIRSMSTLREIDFGQWEGLRWSEIEAKDAAYASRWIAEFPTLPAPGGELFAAFETRVLACIGTILKGLTLPVVVVSHGGVMRVVLQQIFGYTQAEAWARTKTYGSVVCLALADARQACDDTSHLRVPISNPRSETRTVRSDYS